MSGAVVLLRDISELRRRDRLLLSKDATIREIHHRVKNNLQTISSLLRLQGRRLDVARGEGRDRGVGAPHPLDRARARDPVPRGGRRRAFIEIVRPLVRMVEEGLQSPERPIASRVKGDGGTLPGDHRHAAVRSCSPSCCRTPSTTPSPRGRAAGGGHVVVELDNDGDELGVARHRQRRRAARGLLAGDATGLGLSIVRTLVTTELDGTIEMRARAPGEPPAGAERERLQSCGCLCGVAADE